MFGFKGVGDYERGVARQERVAPFLSAPIFTRNAHSLLFASQMSSAWGSRCAPAPFFAAYGSIRGDFQDIPISSSSFFFFFRAVCFASVSCLTFFFTSSYFFSNSNSAAWRFCSSSLRSRSRLMASAGS